MGLLFEGTLAWLLRETTGMAPPFFGIPYLNACPLVPTIAAETLGKYHLEASRFGSPSQSEEFGVESELVETRQPMLGL